MTHPPALPQWLSAAVLTALGLTASGALAAPLGPYDPQVGFGSTEAIHWSNPGIYAWATDGAIIRGPQFAEVPSGPDASFGTLSDAFGVADATPTSATPVVSLGDGGIITMSFGFALSLIHI